MNLKERVKMAIVKEHTANNLFNSTTLENTINRIFKIIITIFFINQKYIIYIYIYEGNKR